MWILPLYLHVNKQSDDDEDDDDDDDESFFHKEIFYNCFACLSG